MDAVNEFRKLLNVDLAKFQFSDFDDIKELNKKSYKFSKALNGLDSKILDEEPAEQTTKPNDDRKINKTIDLDDIPVKSALNGQNVKSFEELVNKSIEREKTNNNHNSGNETLNNTQQQKKPFLKRGEGLKRFQISKPSSNTIEKVQETRRCIKALNLRGENQEKKPSFVRKIVNMPCQVHVQTIPKRIVSPKQIHIRPNAPRSISTSSNSSLPHRRQTNPFKQDSLNSHNDSDDTTEMLNKFSSLFHNQNELKNNRIKNRIADLNIVPVTVERDPIVRKRNVISKIDQLEQRLLYLLNLKSNLVLSTPLDDLEETTPKDSHDFDKPVDNNDEEQNSQTSNMKPPMNVSLENIKREIAQLNDKMTSMKIEHQQEQLEKLRQLQKAQFQQESSKRSGKKSKKKDSRESSAESNESESEVVSIPVKTVSGEKDVKTVVYKHKNGSISTVFPTGMKVIQYQNGQIEKLFPDGSKQIIYPDNQHKIVHPDNSEELHLPDGRVYFTFSDGSEKVQYPNGDVEVKTKDYTKRHFANGNIKTIYSNGYQETIYSNGRIRLKDNHGNVLCDKRC